MSEFNLIMPFKDQSKSFTNGFECGQIWEKMENGVEFKMYPIHYENIKQIQMMADRFGYELEILDYNIDWSEMNGKKIRSDN